MKEGFVILQHEVRGGYGGCSVCKHSYYPYYLGDDKKFYCEDCAKVLVKQKQARFGAHDPKSFEYCRRCKGTGREK